MAKLNDELKQQQQLIDDLKQRMLDLRRAKENATNPADVAALSKQLRATSLDLGDAGQKFNNLSKAQAAATEWAKKLDQAERGVALGFGLATASVGGFVRAGLQGTTLGERLAFTQKQLSMQIASVFVPWIEKGVTALQHLTERFRGLSGEQQQQIARWTALGFSMIGSLVIVPKLTAALKALGGSLGLSIAANPLVAVTAGIVGLLGMTEEGRRTLQQLGEVMSKVFVAVADSIKNLALPALQHLADFLATPAGRMVALGALGVAVGAKLVIAFRAVAASVGYFNAALGAAIAAAMILDGLLNKDKGKSAYVQATESLAAQVKSGRMTMKEAEEEVKRMASEEASRLAAQGGPEVEMETGLYGKHKFKVEIDEESLRKELERTGLENLKKQGAGRSDLTLARTGTEDARATIRRLEDSVLKVDSGKDTAKNTGDTAKAVEAIRKIAENLANLFGKKDNRPDTGKDD